MTMPFVSALRLRVPVPENDMAGMLASWMDASPGLDLSSSDCQGDLETIGKLRMDIGSILMESETLKSIGDESVHSMALSEVAEKLHQYYNYLLECEGFGMVQQRSEDLPPPLEFLSLNWQSSAVETGPFVFQKADSLEAERANVMWNLAALEAHQASKEDTTTKLGWNKASKRLQNAASWLGHLLTLIQDQGLNHYCGEMSTSFVSFWQALLLAQAQHCIYDSLSCVKRPMQLLAAKLAAAAVPLYGEVEMIAQNDESLTTESASVVPGWINFARAWGAYMSCQAEYHQSQIHKEKKQWGQELARLDLAYQHVAVCKSLCEEQQPQTTKILDELRGQVDKKLTVLQERLEVAQRENNETHRQAIPTQHELAEIIGEKLVKCDELLSKLLRPKSTEPIFQGKPPSVEPTPITANSVDPNPEFHDNSGVTPTPLPIETAAPPPQLNAAVSSSFLDRKPKSTPSPHLQTYVAIFKVEMNEIIQELARDSEDQSEVARLQLNEVHLPHSVTTYKQEQSGGGLPDELWERVHAIQVDNSIIQLKQDLWELNDAVELARGTHQKVTDQLDYDTRTDQTFREENPNFSGHDASDAQRSFRKRLANYHKLLSSAQEGDLVLFEKMKQFDIEPKYDLLQLPKSQLDLLLPGAQNRDTEMVVDTEHLSYLCGELIALFQKKADLITTLKNEFHNFDIARALETRVASTRKTDKDYLNATKDAQKAFDKLLNEIRSSMKHQDELQTAVLVENESFMNARRRTTNSQSAESCIAMMEDAIDEIDQLSKHLKEGKDFYSVVIPKLDELKQQVGDVSTRLTVERLEYCEHQNKATQEQEDAEMAQQLHEELPAAAHNDDENENENDASETRNPPAAASAASLPVSKVDDEKVATLVAMEFDADKVVAALEKYDNNMDDALNDLLGG